MVAMPLSAKTVKKDQDYRIQSLSGGKTFQQKMEHQGVVPGGVIQIHDHPVHHFQIELLQEGKVVALGLGEAEKVIIEVMNDRQG